MRISANDFSAFINGSLLIRYASKYLFTRDPVAHKEIVGSNNSDQFNFPYFLWASQYPRSSPGTATAKPPF